MVTGASSGIGRALACELSGRGADVLLSARREARLAELANELKSSRGRVIYQAGDITAPEVRASLFQAAQDAFGGLDLLINNAGVGAMGLFTTPARRDSDASWKSISLPPPK